MNTARGSTVLSLGGCWEAGKGTDAPSPTSVQTQLVPGPRGASSVRWEVTAVHPSSTFPSHLRQGSATWAGAAGRAVPYLEVLLHVQADVVLPGDDEGVGLQEDLERLHRAFHLDLQDDHVARGVGGVFQVRAEHRAPGARSPRSPQRARPCPARFCPKGLVLAPKPPKIRPVSQCPEPVMNACGCDSNSACGLGQGHLPAASRDLSGAPSLGSPQGAGCRPLGGRW